MKIAILFLVLISIAAVLAACKRGDGNVAPAKSGVVLFPDAGITLEAGPEWQRVDVNPGLPVCPPTLIGSAGMVRVMLFAPAIADLTNAASVIRSVYDGEAGAVKDSFHKEEFTTETGLRGQDISYKMQSEKSGVVTEAKTHKYVFQRKDGRCVAISHVATDDAGVGAVRQMVQKSLKLQ